MEEQLISFETAMLAKEKGFDGDSYYCQRNGTTLWYFMHDTDKTPELYTYEWFNSFDNMLAAPTQSLLQKWLREKHSLHINIIYSSRIDINGYFYGIIESEESEDCLVYNTYEETLEKGLQEALKLIK